MNQSYKLQHIILKILSVIAISKNTDRYNDK